MTTVIDVVHQALTEAPQSRHDIAEATGLELTQISPALSLLAGRGEALREDGGWVLGGGKQPPVRVHAAAQSEQEGEKVAKTGGRRARRAVSATPARDAAAGAGVPAGIEFARFGDYVVVKRVDLAALLSVIERWRRVAEAAA